MQDIQKIMAINQEQNYLYQKQIYTYKFQDNIDKIYPSFFNLSILEKAGLLGVLYNIEITSKNTSDDFVQTFLVTFLDTNCTMERNVVHRVESPLMKSYTQRITSINNQPLRRLLQVKFSLFMDSSNYYTTFIISLEADSEDNPYIQQYFEGVSHDVIRQMCEKLNKYFLKWNSNIVTMESIVIHRPLRQVYNYITDFKTILIKTSIGLGRTVIKNGQDRKEGTEYTIIDEKGNIRYKLKLKTLVIENKKAIITFIQDFYFSLFISTSFAVSIIHLSSVSSFVNIETDFHCKLKGDLYVFISEMHQSILKLIKNQLETNTCYLTV